MIIFKESPKKRNSPQEATPVGLDDVIGLAGFSKYVITGSKLYIGNFDLGGIGKLVQGPGSVSPLDISLVVNKTVIVSIPYRAVKAIRMRQLNVLFQMDDGTIIEFMKN